MARPVVIREETIIDAARAVFLERGFKATTAEVAERAGISEGSIFKRFKSKYDLFQAAMKPQLEEPHFIGELSARVGRGQVRDNLITLGMEMVEHFRMVMPLMMMAWSNPGHNGLPCVANEPNPPPIRILKTVSSFFEAEMRLGRLRRHDPEVVARSFLGGLHNFVTFELLFKSSEELPLPTETFVRGLAQLLWVGIEPSQTSSSSSS
jgi:AcrR family transcriptional regulator